MNEQRLKNKNKYLAKKSAFDSESGLSTDPI